LFVLDFFFLLRGERRGKRAQWRGEVESAFPALKFYSDSEMEGFKISILLVVKNKAEMCIFRILS